MGLGANSKPTEFACHELNGATSARSQLSKLLLARWPTPRSVLKIIRGRNRSRALHPRPPTTGIAGEATREKPAEIGAGRGRNDPIGYSACDFRGPGLLSVRLKWPTASGTLPDDKGGTCSAEYSSMCDYSLEHLESRPAAVGDKLVTTKFGQGFTRGFCSVHERRVPVCVQPGTELAFDHDVEIQAPFRLFPVRSLGAKVARFRRVKTNSIGITTRLNCQLGKSSC